MDYTSALNPKKKNNNGALGNSEGILQFNDFMSSFSPAGGTDLTFRQDEEGDTTLGAKGNVGAVFKHGDVNANVNAQFNLPDLAGNNSSITASRRPLQNVTGLSIDEPAYMLQYNKKWD